MHHQIYNLWQFDLSINFPYIIYIINIMFKIFKLIKKFSKISKQELQKSSYDQLVNKMAAVYGYQQFKSKSSISLLQMHNLFNLFQKGDRVLDVGAGKCGWTDLAIKYTNSLINDPLVISVDKLQIPKIQGAYGIKGDINQKQTKVQIAQLLKDHQLNTILIDVDTKFSGILEMDSLKINSAITSTLQFSEKFLKKGGTMVFKALKSDSTNQLQEQVNILFNTVSKYKPSYIRSASPVIYYVLKGFLINQNYLALKKFKDQYNKQKRNKEKIIKKYQGYKFNPEKIVRESIEAYIYQQLQQNIPEQQILKEVEDQSFLNPQQYIDKYKKMASLSDSSFKQKEKFLKDEISKNFSLGFDIPQTQQQIISYVEKILQKQQKKQKKDQKKEEDQLLKQNEYYMKYQSQSLQEKMTYQPFDLNQELQEQDINKQNFSKLKAQMPALKQLLDKFESDQFKDSQINEFFKFQQPSYDPKQQKINQNEIQMEETLINQQQFQKKDEIRKVDIKYQDGISKGEIKRRKPKKTK